MKAPEEYFDELKELYETDDLIEFLYNIQKEVYNQAIDDAIKNAKTKIITTKKFDGGEFRKVVVDKDSILKLKK